MKDLLILGDVPASDDADDAPSYADPGRALFSWYWDPAVRHWCADVYDYDSDSSLYWMEEGVGIGYQLEQQLELEQEGWYVAEGVTGSVWHSWEGEFDEEWYVGRVRYATRREVETETLDD